jgi:hypothetical protein
MHRFTGPTSSYVNVQKVFYESQRQPSTLDETVGSNETNELLLSKELKNAINCNTI